MFKELLRRKATVAEWQVERLIDGIPFGFCNQSGRNSRR